MPIKSFNKVFLFSLFHVVFFVTLFTLFRPIGSIDVAENFFWGRHFELGFYKHPPLFAWISGIFGSIFGISIFTNYLIYGVFIFTTFISIYFLAKEFLSEKDAVIAVLLLEALSFAGVSSRTFNANLVQVPFWVLTPLFYLYGIKTKKLIYFAIAGFFLGLAFLGKYFALLLGFIIFISFISNKETLKLLKTPLPYFMFFCFLVTISPHIYWLFQNDFMPLDYIKNKQVANCNFFTCRKQALNFFLLGILACLPIIFGFLTIFQVKKLKNLNLKNPRDNLLFCVSVLPFTITSITSLVLGISIVPKWASTMFFFLPIFLINFLKPIKRKMWRKNLKIFLVSMFAIWFLVVAISGLVDKKRKNNHYEIIKEIANFHVQNWQNEFGSPLKFISGDISDVGIFFMFSKTFPDVIPEDNLKFTPYLNPENIKNNGHLILLRCSNLELCIKKTQEIEVKEVREIKFKKNNFYLFVIYVKPYSNL